MLSYRYRELEIERKREKGRQTDKEHQFRLLGTAKLKRVLCSSEIYPIEKLFFVTDANQNIQYIHRYHESKLKICAHLGKVFT